MVSHRTLGASMTPTLKSSIKPLAFAVAMASQQAYAVCQTEFTVTNAINNSNDASSLQGAFDAANQCSDADATITIADSLAGQSISVSEFNLYAYGGNSITLVGPSENRITIVRNSSLSLFISQESGQLNLKNLILDGNNYSSTAPGVDVQTGSRSMTMDNVLLKNFKGNIGGAVNAYNTDVTIIDSVFEGNQASVNGGAVNMIDGNLTIDNTTFNNNSTTSTDSSTSGGGAITFGSESSANSLIISDSQFSGNKSFYNGGAIYHKDNGKVDISDSTFDDNLVENWYNTGANAYGGAIYLSSVDESKISGSTFSNNESEHIGGAIYINNQNPSSVAELEIIETVFDSNQALSIPAQEATSLGLGAAIYITDSSETYIDPNQVLPNLTLNLDQVTFKANSAGTVETAGGNGNALYMNSGSLPFTVNLTDSTLQNDTSAKTSIYVNGGHTLNVKRSLFANNMSTVINAASSTISKPVIAVENSTFTENTSTYGMINISSPLGIGSYIKHSTISGNTSKNAAIIYGGGISGMEENLVISHSILSNNSSTYGQVCNLSEANMDFAMEYTLVDDADTHEYCRKNLNLGGNQLGSQTNNNVIDPLLSELADNGGATQTMLLASNSPAVDAGNPNIEGNPNTDQRGSTRIMRGQIDLGAVEIGNSLPVFNGLTNVTLDVSDELSVDVDLATDADGDSLTYSVSGLPAGITFDESLNTISGSISKATFNASQTYDITVTANDGYGETEAKFTVTLTDTNGIYSENKSSGSGAFSYLWLSLLGLMFARRRK